MIFSCPDSGPVVVSFAESGRDASRGEAVDLEDADRWTPFEVLFVPTGMASLVSTGGTAGPLFGPFLANMMTPSQQPAGTALNDSEDSNSDRI